MDSGLSTPNSDSRITLVYLLLCALMLHQSATAADRTAGFGLPSHNALQLRANNTDIEFGRISSENGLCRMNTRGTLMGYGGQTCLGSGRFAEFEVFGQKKRIVNISLAGSGTKPGIQFVPRMNGRQTKVLSRRGKRRVRVAGDLELDNAVDGKYSLTYLIMVNYE